MSLDIKYNLRFQEKSCWNCRYYRQFLPKEGAATAECLALGRTMGITPAGQSASLIGWARERLCDLWKRRPKTWVYFTQKNPHWEDEYYKRETLQRMHKRLERAKR